MALAWLAAIILSFGSSDVISAAAPLKWSRSAQVRRQAHPPTTTSTAKFRRPQFVRRDANVVAAAWEQEDTLLPQPSANPLRSVVVDRSVAISPTRNDPFDQSERVAQLPDDPFGESVDQAAPMPEPALEDVDDIADALREEIDRREDASDPFDETSDRPSDDLLEDLRDAVPPIDEFDDDWLKDPITDEAAEERLRRGEDTDVLDADDLDADRDPSEDESRTEPTPEQREQLRKQLIKEREASDKNCQEEFAKIKAEGIHSIDLSIRIDGNAGEDFPLECSLGNEPYEDRRWPEIIYNWKASGICHKPLYFEQVHLERYGHSWGPYLQPIMSGVHFFGTVPVLPYKMGIRTPTECVYTLGYYRPGSCAPYMVDAVPFTWRAALLQSGVATGLPFVYP